MSANIVVGIFKDTDHAEMAIEDLRAAGVADTDISYLYTSEDSTIIEERDDGGTKVGEGAASGAGTGAVIGGLAGLAVANGILPGLGSLFVAGPLASALGLTGAAATTAAGAVTGAAAGGLIGALAGLGINKNEARIYEERIKKGSILVAAKVDDATQVKDIFERHGADEIRGFENQ